MTEQEEPNNVIPGTFGESSGETHENQTRFRGEDGSFCAHRSYIIHRESRTVTCKGCDSLLDAWAILSDYASSERTLRHYRKLASEAVRRLDGLLAEEKRVKARTKNASRKDAEAAVAAEREATRTRMEKTRYELEGLRETVAKVLRNLPGETRTREKPTHYMKEIPSPEGSKFGTLCVRTPIGE